jgi:hypothetical protein
MALKAEAWPAWEPPSDFLDALAELLLGGDAVELREGKAAAEVT